LFSGWIEMGYGTKKILLLLLCFLPATLYADTITGKVLNQTTQKPSAGDDVVLLRMGEGMQEEARVRTGEQGAFSMKLAHPEAQYVLRVLHQGVNYDHTLTGTSAVQLEVFDTVSAIKGLNGALGIAQLESDGANLKVTEMYSITNASMPPVTQTGAHNFEISLPAGATLDAFMAKRAQGVWVNLTAAQEKQGNYAVDYPLRPGDTLFKYIYHLPASGAITLKLKLAYPIKSFAVMHPPTMEFRPLQAKAFSSPGVVKGLRVEQAVGGVTRDVPAFVISGVGTVAAQAPADRTLPSTAANAAPTDAPTAQPEATLPNARLPNANLPNANLPNATPPNANLSNTEDHSSKDAWAIGSLTLLLIVGGVFALWRRERKLSAVRAFSNTPVIQALKDELFQLETERSRGAISAEQYDSTRDALNLSLQRALAREKN
jgi:hypothetical protein